MGLTVKGETEEEIMALVEYLRSHDTGVCYTPSIPAAPAARRANDTSLTMAALKCAAGVGRETWQSAARAAEFDLLKNSA